MGRMLVQKRAKRGQYRNISGARESIKIKTIREPHQLVVNNNVLVSPKGKLVVTAEVPFLIESSRT